METLMSKVAPEKITAADYEYLGKLQSKTGKDSLALINLNKAIK
jgi:hypothetical protein